MRRWLAFIWICLALLLPLAAGAGVAPSEPSFRASEIPEAARQTLAYVRLHQKAPPGHVGGRRFGNYERLLPQTTAAGKRIFYQEWDIYPRQTGRSRGPRRLVTGSDERAWYTPDHYKSFKEIR